MSSYKDFPEYSLPWKAGSCCRIMAMAAAFLSSNRFMVPSKQLGDALIRKLPNTLWSWDVNNNYANQRVLAQAFRELGFNVNEFSKQGSTYNALHYVLIRTTLKGASHARFVYCEKTLDGFQRIYDPYQASGFSSVFSEANHIPDQRLYAHFAVSANSGRGNVAFYQKDAMAYLK